MTLTESSPRRASSPLRFVEGSIIAGWYDIREDLTGPDGHTVWLATDQVIEKDVVLHFIPLAAVADAPAMAELQRAVKKCRPIIHPNVVRVRDFVRYGDTAAISMERVAGDSLAGLLRRKGRFDPDDIAAWIAQLAETLEHMHRLQIFHRDLAPANLFAGSGGELFVANFETGRVVADAMLRTGIADESETHRAYIAPGQSDVGRTGQGDDVYGFGVLVYELLTGRVPVTIDDSVPEIRRRIRPSMTEVRASAGNGVPVPASWEKAIAACLENAPGKRPRNFSEIIVLMELQRQRDGIDAATTPKSDAKAGPAETQPDAQSFQEIEQSPACSALAENTGQAHPAGERCGMVRSGVRKITAGKPVKETTDARQSDGPPVLESASRSRTVIGIQSSRSAAANRLRPRAVRMRIWMALLILCTGICGMTLQDDSQLSGGGFRPRLERKRQRARAQHPALVTTPDRPVAFRGNSLPPALGIFDLIPADPGTPMPTSPTRGDGKPPVATRSQIKDGASERNLNSLSAVFPLVPKSLASVSEDPEAVDVSFDEPQKNAKARPKASTQSPGRDRTAKADVAHSKAAKQQRGTGAGNGVQSTLTATGVSSVPIVAAGR